MLKFEQTMDPKARTVTRNGILLGCIFWHTGTMKYKQETTDFEHQLTLSEIRQLLEEMERLNKRP